jgi:ABC-type nickel/cobalt efflux system permease component RcnA
VLSIGDTLILYLRTIGWALAVSIGFSMGTAIAVWIFALISKDIDEWAEIMNKNYGVAAILVALIVMIGLLVMSVV